MSRSKFQVAAVTGMIVAGVIAVQGALPRLANGAGLLYLRAEYKLATGDTVTAMRLMQQAAAQRNLQAPAAVQKTPSAESCSRAASRKPARSVLRPQASQGEVQRSQNTVPWAPQNEFRLARSNAQWEKISGKYLRIAAVSLPPSRDADAIRAWVQEQHQQKLAETMRLLQAKLKNLPAPSVPVPPAATLEFAGQLPLE